MMSNHEIVQLAKAYQREASEHQHQAEAHKLSAEFHENKAARFTADAASLLRVLEIVNEDAPIQPEERRMRA